MEDEYSTIFVSAEDALGLYRVSRNFDKIILNFSKFEENFEKHEIKNFRENCTCFK